MPWTAQAASRRCASSAAPSCWALSASSARRDAHHAEADRLAGRRPGDRDGAGLGLSRLARRVHGAAHHRHPGRPGGLRGWAQRRMRRIAPRQARKSIEEPNRTRERHGPSARMPVVFLPHGGGPWPFVDLGFVDAPSSTRSPRYLRSVRELPQTPPKALLVVSAHWEEPVPTVMTSAHPPMLYDYSGFPPESYQITWPAPGEPALAARVRELLGAAGFETGDRRAARLRPRHVRAAEAHLPGRRRPGRAALAQARARSGGAPRDRPRARAAARRGRVHHRQRHDVPQPARVSDPRARAGRRAFDAWLRERRRRRRRARRDGSSSGRTRRRRARRTRARST